LDSCNNASMNNTAESDEALIEHYARGDAVAFDQLYRRHELRVWRYLERNVRNQAICDELLQEVWLALARNTASLESTAPLKFRLLTLAHDRMIGSPGARAAQASPEATASLPVVARDPANALAQAIGQLPREEREAYLLHIEGELSVGEIAEITESTIDTTHSRLHLARLKMPELLNEKSGSEVTPSQDPLSEVDHLYRRLSTLDPSRPSEWVRRKVQAYAAQQAAERTVRESAKAKESIGAMASTQQATPVPRQAEPTAKKSWLLPVAIGAVAVVGFLVVPRLMTPRNTSMPALAPAPVSQPETTTPQVAEASAPRSSESASSESASSAPPSSALQSSAATLPAAPAPAAQLPAPTSPAPVAPRSSAPPAPVVASDSAGTPHAQSPIKVRIARQSAATPQSAATTSDRAETATQAAPPAPPVNSAPAPPSISVPSTDTKVASAAPPPPAAPPAVTQSVPTPASAPVAAASKPSDELWRAAESGDIGGLQAALTGNVDVNSLDAKGHTALVLMNGHVGIIRALLAHGANPNTPDSRGTTPLRAAYDRGNSDIVLLLQRHSAH
jgi:DNA-directed RNA polymerase specialized sigma24 family protein